MGVVGDVVLWSQRCHTMLVLLVCGYLSSVAIVRNWRQWVIITIFTCMASFGRVYFVGSCKQRAIVTYMGIGQRKNGWWGVLTRTIAICRLQ